MRMTGVRLERKANDASIRFLWMIRYAMRMVEYPFVLERGIRVSICMKNIEAIWHLQAREGVRRGNPHPLYIIHR
jgi:hypothetical protein